MTDNNFIFLCVSYNAESTILQTLKSFLSQSYRHYSIIIVDDMSTDNTIEVVNEYKRKNIEENDIFVIQNKEKKWLLNNMLLGVKECSDDDIICLVDCDDWLTENDCLYALNEVYSSNEQIDAAWTAHRWGYTSTNISNYLPEGADPYKYEWVSSHLKTFRKKVLNGVSDTNFRNRDNVYFKRACDQALYLPVLKNSRKSNYLPFVTYHYTIDISDKKQFHTPEAHYQVNEAEYIRNRGYISSGESWEKFI